MKTGDSESIRKVTNSRKARSVVLASLVALALGTAIVSGLYVSGILGNHLSGAGQVGSTTMKTDTTGTLPGGALVVRNSTESICISSSTSAYGNNTSEMSNETTSTSTTTTSCLPIGYA